jgi:hypothetical protein
MIHISQYRHTLIAQQALRTEGRSQCVLAKLMANVRDVLSLQILIVLVVVVVLIVIVNVCGALWLLQLSLHVQLLDEGGRAVVLTAAVAAPAVHEDADARGCLRFMQQRGMQ